MKMIESYSSKAKNPSTLSSCRAHNFKFDTGHSAVFYEGFGWIYRNKAGSLLNENKGLGHKVINSIKLAIKAGM